MSTMTPNMSLVVSTIGVDSGLLWEQNLNSSLLTIDQHNHASGNGVQIPPAGLNINSSLSFQNQEAINLKAVLFTDQSSLATLNALYTVAGELYYNDPSGAVQITLGGAVNATSSGISSGAATASFVSGVLVVNAASNTPANIKAGSILLGNNVPASKFLTLAPPASMAANYGLTLPSIPGAQQFLSIDTSGNISGYANVSGGITASNIATATITTSQISASAGIVGTQLSASANILPSQLAPANTTVSISDSGSFSTSSSTYVGVTNMSVTLTGCSGSKVIEVKLIPGAGTSPSWVQMFGSSGSQALTSLFLKFVNVTTSTVLGVTELTAYVDNANNLFAVAPSAFQAIDFSPAVGNNNYVVNVLVTSGTLQVQGVKLFAKED